MRVLFDATNIIQHPTGAGLYTFHILSEFSRRSLFPDATVLVRDDLPASHPLFILPFVFLKVPYGTLGPIRDVRLSWLLYTLRKQYDLFFCFMPHLPFFYTHRHSCIVVHDVGHLTYPFFSRPWHRWYFRAVISRSVKRAAHVCTVSLATKKEVQDRWHVPDEHIAVAYCNTALPHVDDTSSQSIIDRPYILYVGERRPHKNLVRLIRTFAKVKTQAAVPSDLALVCIGKDYAGHTKLLEQTAREAAVFDDVFFFPPCDEKRLMRAYQGARVLVLVSLYEGFGMPLIEAMQYHVPIVTSNRSAMKEVAGDAAYLVDPKNEAEMAQGIGTVISDGALGRELVEKGMQRRQNFSWEKTADIIRDVISSYGIR